jgi:hypothetical protein
MPKNSKKYEKCTFRFSQHSPLLSKHTSVGTNPKAIIVYTCQYYFHLSVLFTLVSIVYAFV